MRHFLPLILFAVATTIPARAGVIYSYYDSAAPLGHSPVIGMVVTQGVGETYATLVTAAEIYWVSPLEPTLKVLDATGFVAGLDDKSSVARMHAPNKLAYVGRGGLQHLLVTFDVSNAETTKNVPAGLVRLAGMVEDEALQVYVSAILGRSPVQGIMQYRSFTDPTLLRNIGGGGPGALTLPTFALATGAGRLYALDEANSRVNRYDTSTGDYLGSFSVTGVTAGSNAMVFDPRGWIYLSNGQGGATSYDVATGAPLNTFRATSGTPDRSGAALFNEPASRDAMVLDAQGKGKLYVWDDATSFHAYNTNVPDVPEPGTLSLAALGVLLVLAHRRRN